MNRVCRIVCAGENKNYNFKFDKNDYIIAVDGGLKFLEISQIEPDIIIGDFDSLGYIPENKNILKLNVEKDETDCYFAVNYAIDKGFNNLCIYCGTGGEIDHTLANIQVLTFIAKRGKKGFLFDGKKVITAVNCGEVITFSEKAEGKISILSCENESLVKIEGLKYKGENILLSNDFPLGVRNQFNGYESKISVKSGSIYVIFNADQLKYMRDEL